VAVGSLLVLLPALGWLPYLAGAPPGTASASAVRGYHNGLAFLLMAAVCGAGLAGMILAARREPRADGSTAPPDPPPGPIVRAELAVVVALIATAYFPPALVRYVPYVEDDYWLTLLHRMDGGLSPYADFESLYGPLMIHAPALFLEVTGYSALAYATFIGLAEVSLYAAVTILLQRLVPERRQRWAAMAVVFVLLANTLFGLSWNGWRRLAPALILLFFARAPLTHRTAVLTGIATGALLAYSHDFGVLAGAAVVALHAYHALWEGRRDAIPQAFVFGGSSLGAWTILAVAALGAGVTEYAHHALSGAARFAAEASFPFYWTVNSLAAFAVLVLALFVLAPGLAVRSRVPATPGDRMLAGGAAYAIVAMKSGLNRADMWHIAAPLLPLILGLLLPWPRARFPIGPRAMKLANAAIAVFTLTYLLALLPTGSLMMKGLARGAADLASGRSVPDGERVALRSTSIEYERSEPRPDILATGALLATPELRDRPVFLYGNAWDMDKRLGVHRIGYPTDDFLLSDDAGLDVRALLEARPETLVVVRARPYRRLLEGLTRGDLAFETLLPDTPMSRFLSVVSTIHYEGAQLEYEQKERRWARTVGDWMVRRATKVAEQGDLVVLSLRAEEQVRDEP
jgi:hypothetical protein